MLPRFCHNFRGFIFTNGEIRKIAPRFILKDIKYTVLATNRVMKLLLIRKPGGFGTGEQLQSK